MVHKNVTGGCGPSIYCPANSTTRAEMAVFVLVSKEPPGYVPPACGATSVPEVSSMRSNVFLQSLARLLSTAQAGT